MEERKGNIKVNGQEQQPVVIVDRGEDFKNGGGRIPDHDKIEIEYSATK